MHTNVKMNAYKIDFICIQNCVLMHTNFFSSCPPLFAPLHRNLKQLCTQYLHSSKCTSRFVAFCFRQALQATSALVARHPALHCFRPLLRCRSRDCRVPFTHHFVAVRETVEYRSPIASLLFGVLSGCLKIGCQEVFYHPKKPSSYPSKSIRRGQKRHPATRHPAYQNRSILFHSLLLPLGARLHKRENRAVRFVGSFFFALIGKPPPPLF